MIPVDRSQTRSGLKIFNGVVSFTSHPNNAACEYFIEPIATSFNSVPRATAAMYHDEIGKMRYGVGGIMFLPYPNTSGHVASRMASNTDYLVLLGSGILYDDGAAAYSIKIYKNFGSQGQPKWNRVQEIRMPSRYINDVSIEGKNYIIVAMNQYSILYKRDKLLGEFVEVSRDTDEEVGSYLSIKLVRTSQGLFCVKSNARYNGDDNKAKICRVTAKGLAACQFIDASSINTETDDTNWFGNSMAASGDRVILSGNYRAIVYKVNSSKQFAVEKVIDYKDYTFDGVTLPIGTRGPKRTVDANGKFLIFTVPGRSSTLIYLLDMDSNYAVRSVIDDLTGHNIHGFAAIVKCTTNCQRIISSNGSNRISVYKRNLGVPHELEYQIYTNSFLDSLELGELRSTKTSHNLVTYTDELEVNNAQLIIKGYDHGTGVPYVYIYNLNHQPYLHVAANLVTNPLKGKVEREITGAELPRHLHKFIREKPPKKINVPRSLKNLDVKSYKKIAMRIVSFYSTPAGIHSEWSARKKAAFANRVVKTANSKRTHKIDLSNVVVRFLRTYRGSRRLLQQDLDEVSVTITYNSTTDAEASEFGSEYSQPLDEAELIQELESDPDFDDYGDGSLTLDQSVDTENIEVDIYEFFDPDLYCQWVVQDP